MPAKKIPPPPSKETTSSGLDLGKATHISADPYAQWFSEHPVLGGIASMISPGVDPHATFGPADFLMALAPAISGLKMAGIPFMAPLGKVFHGTPRVFESFDPALSTIEDKFGKFAPHLAEDPTYAEGYAGVPGSGFKAKEFYQQGRPNVIPAKISAKNALDLFDREHGVDPKDYQSLIDNASPQSANLLKVYKDSPNWATQTSVIHDVLQNDPELLHRAGFDAIKYSDMGNPVWTVLDPDKVHTPWGTPLGPSQIPNPPPELSHVTPAVTPRAQDPMPIDLLMKGQAVANPHAISNWETYDPFGGGARPMVPEARPQEAPVAPTQWHVVDADTGGVLGSHPTYNDAFAHQYQMYKAGNPNTLVTSAIPAPWARPK